MVSDLLLVLLRLGIALPLIALSLAHWLAADRIVAGEPSSTTPGNMTWMRMIGWLFAWLGTFGLIGATLAAGADGIANPQFLTRLPAAFLIGVLGLANLVMVLATASRLTKALRGTTADILSAETGWLMRVGLKAFLPLGVSLLLLVAAAMLAAVLSIATASLGGDDGEFVSVGYAIAACAAHLVVLTGMALVTAAEVIGLSDEEVPSDHRQWLSYLLMALATVYAIAAAVCFSWFGLILVVLYVIAAVSTIGGRRRASQLAAYWSLTNVVRSGLPLEAELEEQAATMTGRARSLLLSAADRLDQGDSWSNAVCRTGLVPRSCWLEVSAAHDADALQTALQASAALETARFARQSDPRTPRAALAYIGVVCIVLLFLVGFIVYYIVPKLKKIFEDFGAELPEITQVSLRILDFGYPLVPMVIFMFGVTMLIAELLVDYYGWAGAFERLISASGRRMRTPDLLRGLRWAVAGQQPLDAALEAMATAPVSFHQKSRLHQAAAAIREGRDPWESLHFARWITRDEADLLQSAQAATNLPWALETLSDAIVARFEYRLEWWVQLLHPAFILVAGFLVAVFGLALLVPLFHLINMLA